MAKPGDPPEPQAKAKASEPHRTIDLPTVDGAIPGTLPSAPPAATLPTGTAVGRYLIVEPLGEGGMGVVYVAHDPELDRRVALKLLRPELIAGPGSVTEGRNRLVREAHAMARLNHPNVIAIYDSGVYGDQVFLAVELVEGSTVKAWLQERPRHWREVLDLFLAAGRGLAAAHEAGLVHRDFKPENVLVGKRGVVKVSDFGLARAAGLTNEPVEAPPLETLAPPLQWDHLLGTPLTRAGVISGTPAYMAPEQILGRGGDARTDEFSFCVALYRSLYGELPFEKRIDPTGDNRIKPPPKGTQVPQWVRRPLLRGLSIKPEDRYPTLDALLAALADDPAVARRRMLTLGGIGALVIATAASSVLVLLRRQANADPCHDPAAKVAAVWNGTTAAQMHAAFAATGNPAAANIAAYVEKAMNRTSAAWLAAYQDACQATHELHTQSEAALNLRLDCLDNQRFQLRAAAEVIAQPIGTQLDSEIGVVGGLPLPSECADAHALALVDQPAPALRPKLDALRLKLARGIALERADRRDEALAVLKPLPDAAGALGARSLEVDALWELGTAYDAMQTKAGFDKSREIDLRVEDLAMAAHMDLRATQAAASIARIDSIVGPADEVDRWIGLARQNLQRVGLGGTAELYVEHMEGVREAMRGHNAEAARHIRRALDLMEKLEINSSGGVESVALLLASQLEPLGQYDEMEAACRKAIATLDSIWGPNSIGTSLPRLDLSESALDLGRLDDCETELQHLFATMKPGVDYQYRMIGLAVQAALQAKRGQRAESLKTAQDAMDMADRMHLLANSRGDAERYLIEAYLRDGEPTLAVDAYEKYLAKQDIAADSPSWISVLRLGGWAHLEAGQPALALPLLERALTLSGAHPTYPGWVPRLRYQIAEALVRTGGDRQRAQNLAQAAHDGLVGLPVEMDLLAEVDAFRGKTFAAR